ncbi:TIGR03943 family putative permease subunit [Streptomyces sp. enrichment culture]|uniref:TIGR03943 family putative permease subunit n=1 Tax=Streptomyces sp. enrichment culture TaxID=1795815 RepID=UPI003F551B20
MSRYGPAVLLLLVGAAVLRISLFSDLSLRYVQAGLRPYLIVSGVLLVLLAVVRAVSAARSSRGGATAGDGDSHPAEDDGGHAHAHASGPRVAWLLSLPAVALLCFPPPALGSYSAAREEAGRAAEYVGAFPALPAGDQVELSLTEFGSRAVYDSTYSLRGRTVRLTGFVTRGDGGTWYVTRLRVACCAADATAVKVEIRRAAAPQGDAWVTVAGTWHPEGELGSDAAWPPVLDAATVRRIAAPSNPYESR